MNICYKVEGTSMLGTDRWFVLKYVIVDATHDSGPPLSTITTTFSKGDSLDIAFPVGDPGSPRYSDVTALISTGPDMSQIPERGWIINVYFDEVGVDFGTAYRVIFEAARDNVKLDDFRIAFISNHNDNPGSQPWGFTAVNALGQHSETGETVPCTLARPQNFRIK
ncbi:MAG: hypothetical protein HY885_07325 [Deltaproteobacteria bacterium]|nr:hypothetical protein [Deltaproteobacteria bacterium]